MKILKYFFEALIIYILFFLFKILGLNLSRKLSSFLMEKLGFIFRKKNLIKNNISRVFKNFSEDKKELLIIKCGLTMVQFLQSICI